MKNLPAKSVDLFVCDLPYGCLGPLKAGGGIPRENTEGAFGGCAWDIPLDLGLFWEQIRRLRKNDHTPCIMFCTTKFGYELIKSNEKEFRYDIVWDKERGVGFLLANKMPIRSHEMIYVFAKKGAVYNRIDITGDFPKSLVSKKIMTRKDIIGNQIPKILDDNTGRRCVVSVIKSNKYSNDRVNKQHPTEKPVELYKWLIERYSNEGDMVLDPTFGSGNSGLASTELKRLYIGIEKDETFFNKFEQLNITS